MGEKIIVKRKKIKVPDNPIIPFIEGDGTGPDIWRATRLVIDAAVKNAFDGTKKIEWMEILAGEKAYNKTGNWLPQETIEAIREHIVAIKGPLTTPIGGGIRSLNVALRQTLDLYACVRPVKYINGVPSPVKKPKFVDMIIYRENTEDVYAGIEFKEGSEEAKKIIELIEQMTGKKIRIDSGIGIKPISKVGSQRLIKKAIDYAIKNKRKSVTMMHKGNIMKYTEGAFREWGYEIVKDYKGKVITEQELWDKYNGQAPKGIVVLQDRIADSMFQQIMTRANEYDVIATLNLNGDYISDALAAQIGGLGMAPGANIGDYIALFEATHGTAPKYTNQDKVNPGSLILSGCMMLEYMGWKKASKLIKKAIQKAIKQKTVTYDLARQIKGATKIKCSEYAQAIVKNMQ